MLKSVTENMAANGLNSVLYNLSLKSGIQQGFLQDKFLPVTVFLVDYYMLTHIHAS